MSDIVQDKRGETGPPVHQPARDASCQLPAAFVGGRLRPYRDVRAAFSPWRRAAMVAWSEREKAPAAAGPTTLH